MALALMVRTRLWLAGEVSAQRDMPLIRRLIERVMLCGPSSPVGLYRWLGVLHPPRETSRSRAHGHADAPSCGRGECFDRASHQTLRAAAGRRDRAAHGRWHARTGRDVEASVAGEGVINTAYIERLNATFVSGWLADPPRRALARRTQTLQHGMYLIGTVYNFCRMRVCSRWSRTPGDGCCITDHC